MSDFCEKSANWCLLKINLEILKISRGKIVLDIASYEESVPGRETDDKPELSSFWFVKDTREGN